MTAVSNSSSQRAFIETQRDRLGLTNLEVITADVNEYQPPCRFDRVMSIEMFEHRRNWRELLRGISGWLRDDGRLFVHVFSHRSLPYPFEGTWAAERFFTAGLMPSHDLIAHFQEAHTLLAGWRLFLISTAQIWRHLAGTRWLVSHYLLAPRAAISIAGPTRQKTRGATNVIRISGPSLGDVALQKRLA